MTAPRLTIVSFLLVTLAGFLLFSQFALAAGHQSNRVAKSHFTEFSATDEWLAGGELGQITCLEGEFSGNPFQPCPPGTDIRIRESSSLSQVYSDDPRLTGLLTLTFNADFGPDFAGPVWGTWTLETDTCDGVWEGRWSGHRAFVPDQPGLFGPGIWIGNFRITAQGYGGCIDRLSLAAEEVVTTITTFPVAYEMLLPCDTMMCLPEGAFSGWIRKPWRRWWSE